MADDSSNDELLDARLQLIKLETNYERISRIYSGITAASTVLASVALAVSLVALQEKDLDTVRSFSWLFGIIVFLVLLNIFPFPLQGEIRKVRYRIAHHERAQELAQRTHLPRARPNGPRHWRPPGWHQR